MHDQKEQKEENAALLRRAWAAYASGDAETFAACVTDDWVDHGPLGETSTLNDERKTMAVHRIAFPDKRTDIHQMVANDELVACHCTTTATIPHFVSVDFAHSTQVVLYVMAGVMAFAALVALRGLESGRQETVREERSVPTTTAPGEGQP